MAGLDILCSNPLNLKNKITKIEHKKIFCGLSKVLKIILWLIDIRLTYFMTPTKTLPLPPSLPLFSNIFHVRSLKVVSTHYSQRGAGGNGDLFPNIFPDSDIAKHFALSTGIRIMKQPTLKGPKLSPKFVSCFVETFDKVTCLKQMNVHLLYCKKKAKQVELVFYDPISLVMALLIISCT